MSSVFTPAISIKAPKKVKWTQEMEEAFHSLKVSLCNFCVLHVTLCSHHFQLHTDASGLGFGSILNVERDSEILPVAFYSRKLRGAKKRYFMMELEALPLLNLFAIFHIYCLVVVSQS